VNDIPPKKIVSVRFWRHENGKEPVREWLKDLPKEQRRIIGEDIRERFQNFLMFGLT